MPQQCQYVDYFLQQRKRQTTGWRRLIGCLKLQVGFRKRASNYRALLQKVTCKDKVSYGSSPPCISVFNSAGVTSQCTTRRSLLVFHRSLLVSRRSLLLFHRPLFIYFLGLFEYFICLFDISEASFSISQVSFGISQGSFSISEVSSGIS